MRIGIVANTFSQAQDLAKKHCLPDGTWEFIDASEPRGRTVNFMVYDECQDFDLNGVSTDPGTPHTQLLPHQS